MDDRKSTYLQASLTGRVIAVLETYSLPFLSPKMQEDKVVQITLIATD